MATDEPRLGDLLLEESELDEDAELWDEDDDTDHTGWFCVSTAPFPCPAAGCTFVAEFMTAAHLILVWEERGDPEAVTPPPVTRVWGERAAPNRLRHAERAKQVGRNPRVVSYERSFGPSA